MGLMTAIAYALIGMGGYAAAGGFSKQSPPKLPAALKGNTKGLAARKSKAEKTHAEAYFKRRNRRMHSRESSRVATPGYLSPAQLETKSLADVLGQR